MAILFKCKMCGGNLEVESGATAGTCAYCGSTMTLPKLDDERSVAAASSVDALHKRMTLFLEDADWQQADQYADRILDIDPEYGPAYMGKLLAKLQISHEQDLSTLAKSSFAEDKDYMKALRFADDALRENYEGYQKICDARLAEEKRLREEEEARRRKEEAERLERERKAEEERKAQAYQCAQEKLVRGDCAGAHKDFLALCDYQDSKQMAERTEFGFIATWATEKGKIGLLGGIAWQVLDVRGSQVLLISKDIIKNKRFDASSNAWKSSEIRTYLNSEFLQTFNKDIQGRILSAQLPDVGTTDKVFLLSIDEAKRYFTSDQARIATYNNWADWWWLRSPSSNGSDYAAFVNLYGNVSTYGNLVNLGYGGVRPASPRTPEAAPWVGSARAEARESCSLLAGRSDKNCREDVWTQG